MFRDCVRITADIRLQLAILLILAVFDVIMTVVGLNMGFVEQNPLWRHLGESVYVFRMATIAIFISILGLASKNQDGRFYRACRKALVIGLVVVGLVSIINVIQIAMALKVSA